jgi:NADH-quinone oxidoreductase subunit N
VLIAAREAGQSYLALTLIVTSVISAGYYLAVVAQMFMRPRRDDTPASGTLPRASAWVAYAAAALLLVLGVYPTPLLDWARASVPIVAIHGADSPPPAPPQSFLRPTLQ